MMGCDKKGEGIPGLSSGGRESLLHWLFCCCSFASSFLMLVCKRWECLRHNKEILIKYRAEQVETDFQGLNQ